MPMRKSGYKGRPPQSRAARSKHAVYQIRSRSTGKVYTGQTNNYSARMQEHRQSARSGSATKIHKAIRSQGWGNFTKKVVRTGMSASTADRVERTLIRRQKQQGKSLNMQSGGKRGAAEWLRGRGR